MESGTMKYDWYQSESTIYINILEKNVKPENFRADVTDKTLDCLISSEEKVKNLNLVFAHKIQPSSLTMKVLSSKIEIKLKKEEGLQWKCLTEDIQTSQSENNNVTSVYPSSLPKKKDWDKLAQEIKKEEESEKLEGEAAVNELFKKIYAEGSDETKKAMNKSFLESGGTVLSTNWKEIGSKTVEVKPPDGVEYRKWDS